MEPWRRAGSADRPRSNRRNLDGAWNDKKHEIVLSPWTRCFSVKRKLSWVAFRFSYRNFCGRGVLFSIFTSSSTWANHQFWIAEIFGPYRGKESMVQPSRQMEFVGFLIHSEEIHKTYILYRPYWIEIMVFWGSTLKSNISMSECSAEHFRLITSVLDFGKGQWLARCQRVGRRFHAIMPLLRVVGNKPMTNRKLMTNPWDTFFEDPSRAIEKLILELVLKCHYRTLDLIG